MTRAPLAPADRLALAASPVFASMALVTGIMERGAAAAICAAAGMSPLGGMAVMYLLMSVFHLGPWLRLMRGGQAAR